MRRLIALVSLLLLIGVEVASARFAVILPRDKGDYDRGLNPPNFIGQTFQNRTYELLSAWLRQNPGGFDVYRPEQIRTSFIARGVVIPSGQYGARAGVDAAYGADSITYSEVIWPGWRMNNFVTNQIGSAGCYPCSLTVYLESGYKVTKPQLFIDQGSGECMFGTTDPCSTGYNGETGDPGHQAPGYGGARIQSMTNTGYVWSTVPGCSVPIPQWKSSIPGTVHVDTTVDYVVNLPMGGYRVLLGGQGSNWVQSPFSSTPPAWRDSLYSPLQLARTMLTQYGNYVWYFPFGSYGMFLSESLNQHMGAGAAPIMWSSWSSGAPNSNGPSSVLDARTNGGDPSLLSCGVAAFDSLSGGDVLGKNFQPLKQSIRVFGVGTRGGMFLGGGISPADTVTYKASIDSLFTLGVPIDVGVRCDSIATYASEINYWRAKGAHFSVERWAGTSMTLAAQFAALKAQVGADRVDAVLGGPKHDFTAAEVPLGSLTANLDSLVYTLYSTGFRALTFNAQSDSATTVASTPPWHSDQRVIQVRYASNSARLMALSYPGYNDRGATMSSGRDSSVAYGSGKNGYGNDSCFAAQMTQRTWYGALTNHWLPALDYGEIFNTSPRSGASIATGTGQRPWFGEPELTGRISRNAMLNTGTNLIVISTSSLGSGGWGAASPNAPGWYQVKWTVNAAKAINAFAGRTLIQFVYPDQIGPQDIRR